jgi:hypothetical protein
MPKIRYVAKPSLKIDGNEAPEDLMEDILQISVEESLHLAGMFTLVIQNAYAPGREQDKPWKHKDLFAIGKSIRIAFGSSTTEAQEFQDPEDRRCSRRGDYSNGNPLHKRFPGTNDNSGL